MNLFEKILTGAVVIVLAFWGFFVFVGEKTVQNRTELLGVTSDHYHIFEWFILPDTPVSKDSVFYTKGAALEWLFIEDNSPIKSQLQVFVNEDLINAFDLERVEVLGTPEEINGRWGRQIPCAAEIPPRGSFTLRVTPSPPTEVTVVASIKTPR